MPVIERSALLPYPAGYLYHLVNDVESYPEFLPWCGDAQIHRADADSMEASILIVKGGLKQWFKTRNRLEPERSIQLNLVEGPFRFLEGNWSFEALDEGCRIELILRFEMKRGLAAAMIAPAFTRIANTLVDSFCERARALHER